MVRTKVPAKAKSPAVAYVAARGHVGLWVGLGLCRSQVEIQEKAAGAHSSGGSNGAKEARCFLPHYPLEWCCEQESGSCCPSHRCVPKLKAVTHPTYVS